MEEDIKKWLEKKKKQIEENPPTSVPVIEEPEPVEEAVVEEKPKESPKEPEPEKVKDNDSKDGVLDASNKIAEFLEKSANVPVEPVKDENKKKSMGMPKLPKFSMPKIPSIKKSKKLPFRKRLMIIILACSAAGTISGLLLYFFLIK